LDKSRAKAKRVQASENKFGVFRESSGRFWGIIAAEMVVDRDFLGFEGGSILAC
jgi:hypothetical protein